MSHITTYVSPSVGSDINEEVKKKGMYPESLRPITRKKMEALSPQWLLDTCSNSGIPIWLGWSYINETPNEITEVWEG